MDLTYTFRHIDATEALKLHTAQKIHKLDKYHLRLDSAHIIMTIENCDHCAEITLVGPGERLVGHAKSSDMYASIDRAVAKLQVQLRRKKDRVRHHKGEPPLHSAL